ncbi:signal recognition particle protein [Filifactor villosus]|uniref:Signal recognition particle protein n=1 Tax=Filifactor villosus TaxID=29374 RepID=A0ABV9QNG3_9FIRM
MIFEGLADKLQNTLKGLKGKGKLTEQDIDKAMREVKLALLEADVNFKVVKNFVKTVKERSLGTEVMESLTPGQQVIKIVNDEMTNLMGSVQSRITFASKPPTIVMMTGLQGAGKTTTVAKIGKMFKNQGKVPMAIACDVYRPAAIKQLQVVGEQAGIAVYTEEGNKDPVSIAKNGVERAKTLGHDLVLIDTAGRLHIDEALMDELKQIKAQVRPTEILLVVDSMTGQDAVNVSQSFDEALGIDGIVLTKLDGDTRGGAALSIKAVTGKPIKFSAIGEKLDDIEPFYPDRMASRILGMGDMLSLIEKAQASFDDKEAKKLEEKLKKSELDFDDFLAQMQQIKKMGPLKNILEMIPGMPKNLGDAEIDDKALVRIEAIIQSMTKKERSNPDIINASRRKRIANGSGTSIQEVNKLLKQFNEMKKMMKKLGPMAKNMKGKKGMKGFPGLPKGINFPF